MSAVVDCHKATGLYDQPLTDEPLCAVAQLLQFSIERLKVLLADEYSPFDLSPDQTDQRDVGGANAALGHTPRPVDGPNQDRALDPQHHRLLAPWRLDTDHSHD